MTTKNEMCPGSCGEEIPVGHDGILTHSGRTVVHHRNSFCHYLGTYCENCHRHTENCQYQQGVEEVLKNLAQWINGNVGRSSETIFLYMTTGAIPRAFDAPSDSGDRGRCIVLLKAIPEWAARLKEIENLNIKGIRNGEEVYPWNEQIPLILSEINKK